jgi:hypothetical protein
MRISISTVIAVGHFVFILQNCSWPSIGEHGSTIHKSSPDRSQAGGQYPNRLSFPMAEVATCSVHFRDALADILPLDHGFLPTLRIADFEVEPWIGTACARSRIEDLLDRKLSS